MHLNNTPTCWKAPNKNSWNAKYQLSSQNFCHPRITSVALVAALFNSEISCLHLKTLWSSSVSFINSGGGLYFLSTYLLAAVLIEGNALSGSSKSKTLIATLSWNKQPIFISWRFYIYAKSHHFLFSRLALCNDFKYNAYAMPNNAIKG